MNILDLVTAIVFIYAVWRGWRQGAVLQICSLIGFFISLYVAAQLGESVGNLLHVDPQVAVPAGFVVVLLLCMVLIAIAARIVKKLLHFVGLGPIDSIAGIVVGVVKYLMILGLLFTVFASINKSLKLVDDSLFRNSKSFVPVCTMSESVLPYVDVVKQGIEAQDEQRDDA